MAISSSYVFNAAKRDALNGDLNWDGADIRVMPVMTSHTSNIDDDTIGDFATLDEFDGTGYTGGTSGGRTLAGASVAVDDTNDRGEADGSNLTFTALQIGTRQIAGFLVYRFVTDRDTSVPIGIIDINDFHPNSGDIVLSWDAQGILQAT